MVTTRNRFQERRAIVVRDLQQKGRILMSPGSFTPPTALEWAETCSPEPPTSQ